jgi:signal transduction histidine kinase
LTDSSKTLDCYFLTGHSTISFTKPFNSPSPSDALIETRKNYVRYVSHKIRTPLNAVFLGLKVVIDELAASWDKRDVERLEALHGHNIE